MGVFVFSNDHRSPPCHHSAWVERRNGVPEGCFLAQEWDLGVCVCVYTHSRLESFFKVLGTKHILPHYNEKRLMFHFCLIIITLIITIRVRMQRICLAEKLVPVYRIKIYVRNDWFKNILIEEMQKSLHIYISLNLPVHSYLRYLYQSFILPLIYHYKSEWKNTY